MRILLVLFLLLLAPLNARAATLKECDDSAVRILSYFMVGRDDSPSTSVTLDQFKAHMEELHDGGFAVITLNDMVSAYRNGKPVPEKSVIITFDGGDRTVLKNALPVLKQYQFPFTVFVAPKDITEENNRLLTWADLKALQESELATIGLHADKYEDFSRNDVKTIRSSLNNATTRFREEMGMNAEFFAYPFGSFDKIFFDVVKDYGFKAALGQHSGVANLTSNIFDLPRFTMTEYYANLNRFLMTMNALPIPVSDVTPSVSHIDSPLPSIGFTVNEELRDNLEKMTCFASGQSKPEINILDNRIELRLKQEISVNRFRINCTLPAESVQDAETRQWRWFGMLLTHTDAITPPSETAY